MSDLLHREESETQTFILESMDLTKTCHPYPSGDGLFDAFWRTLIAGRPGREGFELVEIPSGPSEYGDIFGLLLNKIHRSDPSMPDQTFTKRRLNLNNLHRRRAAKLFRDVQNSFDTVAQNSRLCTTKMGYIGLLPKFAKQGDRICILLGYHVLSVVRKGSMDGTKLVGECYMHGIMKGEVLELPCVPTEEGFLI